MAACEEYEPIEGREITCLTMKAVYRCHPCQLNALRKRAESAERERDEARAKATHYEKCTNCGAPNGECCYRHTRPAPVLDALLAKVERYEKALREIVAIGDVTVNEPNGWTLTKMARAALKEKP